jgi:molecular chaperone DnaJ
MQVRSSTRHALFYAAPFSCQTFRDEYILAHNCVNTSLFTMQVPCDKCEGEGKMQDQCGGCSGLGLENVTKELVITVPAGVNTDSTLKLTGQGDAGALQGPQGSIFVSFDVGTHDDFYRDDADIHVSAPLSFSTAALGGTVTVPTLLGEVGSITMTLGAVNHDVSMLSNTHSSLIRSLSLPYQAEVKVAAGTQPGEMRVMKGKGITKLDNGRGKGAKGDEYIHFKVQVPTTLSKEQKKLLEKLAKLDAPIDKPSALKRDDKGKGSKSFFSRLFG